MKQDALSNFNMPWLPTTGLIIFVVCFCIYVYWTFKKENKELYDRAAMIPLEDIKK
ncbi:MAG: cbb3-type cytochrome c oxidase subunit 3 [Bdellovibrionales bacterium]|nr:cbb3-type cytochrome c oxidase subunit 3 [Bdellovibrionales bacterium]